MLLGRSCTPSSGLITSGFLSEKTSWEARAFTGSAGFQSKSHPENRVEKPRGIFFLSKRINEKNIFSFPKKDFSILDYHMDNRFIIDKVRPKGTSQRRGTSDMKEMNQESER
jgi:hypothetical protein